MRQLRKDERELAKIDHDAAGWILRQDRGLNSVEEAEFARWLSADPRHWAYFARYERHWTTLDKLSGWQFNQSSIPNPDLLAPPSGLARRILPFAAAAAVVVSAFVWRSLVIPSQVRHLTVAANGTTEDRVLEDGSEVVLNRNAVVTVDFKPGERLVHLERGEADFKVAKNAARPFIVDAGGARVRAVGTAFDVKLGSAAVAVLVTEGRVEINVVRTEPETPSNSLGQPTFQPTPETPVVVAGQRAIVTLGPSNSTTQVAAVSVDEVASTLAWKPRQLDFTDTALSDIVTEFNRHNLLQLTIAEPELAAMRISASFRSDNLDGFVRLLESSFDVRAERRGANEIVLHRSP